MSVRLRGKFFFLKQINPLRLCPLAIFKDKIKVSLWNLKLKGSPLVIFVQNLFVLILPLLTRETLFFSVIRRGAVAVYQLNSASKNRDISGYVNPPATFVGVYYARGPDNHPQGALSFRGRRNSYVLIPNNGCLDTRFSLTIIMWVYPESSGPLLHFNPKGWGVHVWIISQFRLFARFVPRSGKSVTAVYKRIKPRQWNYIAASYDRRTGLATLWLDSLPIIQRKIGRFRLGLATNYPIVIGSKPGDRRKFRGRIACVQMYNYAMSAAQIRSKKKQCFRTGRRKSLTNVVSL